MDGYRWQGRWEASDHSCPIPTGDAWEKSETEQTHWSRCASINGEVGLGYRWYSRVLFSFSLFYQLSSDHVTVAAILARTGVITPSFNIFP